MDYPHPVTCIKQVELTTHCNLRCKYCPSPTMTRKKEDMSMEVYKQALLLAQHYDEQRTQRELSLTGIGESTMHPQFLEMVAMARKALPVVRLVITTNGLLITEELCRELAKFRPLIYVSLHRPEKAGLAVELAKKYNMLGGVNASAAISAFDWAGQVAWYNSAPREPCEFLRTGWAVVMVDGTVTTCCMDASGVGKIGAVWDAPETLQMKPFALCERCHSSVP